MLHLFLKISLYFLLFTAGTVFGYLVTLFYKPDVTINFKITNKKSKKTAARKQKNNELSKIDKAEILLNKIKKREHLPIRIPNNVLEGLKIIAKTSDWKNKIDDETLNNIERLYDKWQRNINSNVKQEVVKTSNSYGFDEPEEWTGTMDEYIKAKENGQIKPGTNVHIVEYTGTVLEMDNDGQIEEFMQ